MLTLFGTLFYRTRNEKTTDTTTKYVTTTKTAGKLYQTIPCKNPESDTG